ncbi:SRPBCC family protein [Robertkochia flava]|uniref:SRPBCC family protein n=1 Tax=Robertkochia flava TaxID=3447986 RepID=UPI001CCE06B7|nr:SRPBCC family protein [Robertkochia marina]
MKILKYLLFLFLIAIIGFSVYVTTKPDHYKVERSRLINAPESMVYNYIDDYRKWPEWSPWMEQDPEAQLNFSDPSSGKDAYYSWSGEALGEGNMKTLYSTPDSLMQKISFIKPYESEGDVYWILEKKKMGIEVTWGMEGRLSFMEKAYMFFQGKDMEGLIGPDYERGLLNLDDKLHEEMSQYKIEFKGLTEYGGGYNLYQSVACPIDDADTQISRLLEEIGSYMERENINPAGPPFVAIEKWDRATNAALLTVHIPVRDMTNVASGSTVMAGYQEKGPYYKTILEGDHKNLQEAYEKTMFNMEKLDITIDQDRVPFEVFAKGPDSSDNPADWITEIYVPVAPSIE